MERRHFLRTMLVGGAMASVHTLLGSDRAKPVPAGAREPIIDVHMHAYPAGDAIPATALNKATRKPPGVKDGEAHLQACLAEMKRLNIVKGIVSGGTGDRLAAAMHWQKTAPDRFIAGAGVRGSADIPLPELEVLRKAFAEGRLRVLGEVTAQYAGLSLSDPKFTPYLALAEEFDIPVAVHTGPGGAGISYDECCRGFRASLGNPATMEEALNRHPKLRVNIMHGGWPYVEDLLAVLSTYPQVYTDIGFLTWGQPRAEFHSYLGTLVRTGFGQRVMFGSDQMFWPESIGLAVEGVESATFLTPAQKRDIFYNNAVRFFRL